MSTWPGYLASFIPSLPWRTDSIPAEPAAPQITDRSSAAISNDVSGLGGPRDSGTTARPNIHRQYLNEDELVAMSRGTVYRRICELLPQAATAKGYALTDDSDDEAPLEAELRGLNVMGTFRKADTWGRALGESLVMMVVDERGSPPLSTPLDPSKVTKIHRLQFYDRNEFTPVSYITNPIDGELGDPLLYSLTPRRAGVVTTWQTVHYSRFLRFYGDDLPPSVIGRKRGGRHRWGADAIGQTLWDALRNMNQVASGGSKIAQELSLAVFTMAGAPTAGDQKAWYLKKIRNMSIMKSLVQAILIGPQDKFERIAANPAGFRDLSEDARTQLALLTGHPAALLFGVAPGGLNTDGESWRIAWAAKVGAYQEDRYLRPLQQLIEVVYYAAQGALPKSWGVRFNPLEQLTEEQLADLRTKHTMADVDAEQAGFITQKEARSRYTQPGGFALELQPLDEEIEVLPEPEPEPQPQPREFDARGDFGETDKAVVWFPLSQQARAKHRELQEQAGNIVGVPLEVGRPHMTMLYAGAIDSEAASELHAITADLARRHPHSKARVRSVDTFTSPEGTAIVLLLDAYDADRLESELSRAAAHLVRAKQAGRSFVAHITLGYVSRQLTAQETASLRDLRITGDPPKVAAPASEFVPQVPVGTSQWLVSLSALELRRNGVSVEYPLTGERNDAENHETVRAK